MESNTACATGRRRAIGRVGMMDWAPLVLVQQCKDRRHCWSSQQWHTQSIGHCFPAFFGSSEVSSHEALDLHFAHWRTASPPFFVTILSIIGESQSGLGQFI